MLNDEKSIEMTIYEGNKYILGRLQGIQMMLMAAHKGSAIASNNTKGKERESFINLFLSNILPPHFRFGSGEITDLSGNLSGQLDIVIEYPLLPSIQVPTSSAETRLYLAEGVAAAIEVKSDLIGQWQQVKQTSEKVKQLRRRFSASRGLAPNSVPLFAVGYTGWKSIDVVWQHLQEGIVDGILIIEDGLFIWNPTILPVTQLSGTVTGAWALWGLVVALHRLGTSLQSTSLDLALYARPDWMIIKKICNRLNDDKSVEVNFYDFIDEEGIDTEEGEKILKSLKTEGFIEIITSEDSEEIKLNSVVNIKITHEAIKFTQNMNTPFELT
ncbi:DUF6602 domain-containing protein [Nostoc sp. CCY0012]|uniref:DUF6602 domain-containing protein n=1 Tax=Nostoc sp. CCY0012 TaxID=1056123 RepID=UPI0039C5BF0C